MHDAASSRKGPVVRVYFCVCFCRTPAHTAAFYGHREALQVTARCPQAPSAALLRYAGGNRVRSSVFLPDGSRSPLY